MSASRILDDIHIEAAAILMRSRWKPPMWGPPEEAANLREATPPPVEKHSAPGTPGESESHRDTEETKATE